MSEEDFESQDTPIGPLDQTNPVPFALILDDQYRRQNISNTAYKYRTTYDDERNPLETVIEVEEPNLAAIFAHALSPQLNLMDFNPQMALAKKLENDTLFQIMELKYKRSKHWMNLAVAQVAMSQTIDGMSTEGTFGLWLTKMTGSIREIITGVRSHKE